MKKGEGRRPPVQSPVVPGWLLDLREAARQGTYFECLRVTRDVSTTGVREAWQRLAADLDSLRPVAGLSPDLAEALEEVAQVAEDAFQVLSDPDLRLAYRRSTDAGAP